MNYRGHFLLCLTLLIIPGAGSGVEGTASAGADLAALLTRGAAFETRREYLHALLAYQEDRSPELISAQCRLLLSLGCVSLAKEKLRGMEGAAGQELRLSALGHEAMCLIRWGDPDGALSLLAGNGPGAETTPPPGRRTPVPEEYLRRASFDRIAALAAKSETDRVLEEYRALRKTGMSDKEFPAWVRVHVAQALVSSREPRHALSVLGDDRRSFTGEEYCTARMIAYSCRMALGDYRRAGHIIEELEREMQDETVNRGVWSENWSKEEVNRERGWWLMHQDRLAEAQRHFEGSLVRAPFNTHTRTALAQTYLWRGWPRRALEEFEISRTLDPLSWQNETGYCYALDENGRPREARALARNLERRQSNNTHVRELNRHFVLEDRRALSLDVRSAREYPGSTGTELSLRVEQPLTPETRALVEIERSLLDDSAAAAEMTRGSFGIGWRPGRDWQLGAALGGPGAGTAPFWRGSVSFSPGDRVTAGGAYRSWSGETPLEARARGIDADETDLLLGYRHSESLSVQGSFSVFTFTDGNIQRRYALAADRAVTTAMYWRTRLAAEADAVTGTKADAGYFNPEFRCAARLVPSIEHVFYRRYDTAVSALLKAGAGGCWQEGQPGRFLWFGRFEQLVSFSKAASAGAGVEYGREHYGEDDIDTWNIYTRLNVKL